MEDPCKNCENRQWYAMKFDLHFWGEDCPYECEEYERYKKEKPTQTNAQNSALNYAI